LQYSINVAQNVRIPESQNAMAFRGKIGIPDLVTYVFGMLSPIHLDNKLAVPTEEIDHVWSNRSLTNKFETG